MGNLLRMKVPRPLVLGLLSIYMVLVVPTMTSFKYEDLLGFAVQHMNVKVLVTVPKVISITRKEMTQIMKDIVNDPKSEYPYEKVHGLFEAGTDFVRVVNDLYEVKTKAVTLHEIVHYIQEQAWGIAPAADPVFGAMIQMRREMEAYQIQEAYEWIFNNCNNC